MGAGVALDRRQNSRNCGALVTAGLPSSVNCELGTTPNKNGCWRWLLCADRPAAGQQGWPRPDGKPKQLHAQVDIQNIEAVQAGRPSRYPPARMFQHYVESSKNALMRSHAAQSMHVNAAARRKRNNTYPELGNARHWHRNCRQVLHRSAIPALLGVARSRCRPEAVASCPDHCLGSNLVLARRNRHAARFRCLPA